MARVSSKPQGRLTTRVRVPPPPPFREHARYGTDHVAEVSNMVPTDLLPIFEKR